MAPRAWALAQQLEQAGKDSDLSSADSLFAELETEVARVIADVRGLIETETKSAGGAAS